jgi:hypothetical protein
MYFPNLKNEIGSLIALPRRLRLGIRPSRPQPRLTCTKEDDKTLRLDQLKDIGDDGALQYREPVVLRVVRVCVCLCLEPTGWIDPLWELAPLSLVHRQHSPTLGESGPPDLGSPEIARLRRITPLFTPAS